MNTKISMPIRILMLAIYLVASCSVTGREQVSSMPDVSLEGTAWTLETVIASGSARPLIDGTQISLQFEGGKVQGSAGCNDYGGAYDLQRGRLNISPLDITNQLCTEPPGTMEQETSYLEILTEVTTFEWNANKLTLEVADGQGLRFISAQSSATKSLSGPADPQEMEAFVDGMVAAQLEAYHIPGAAVSVVKNGEIFLAKGYGYADLENRTPVIADHTLFHSGSISKLFTWTAVMQLMEQDKVNLNADVNTYLSDFEIPETYPQPVTLAHLLTHTAGFESRNEGLFVRKAEEIIPLNEYLLKYIPARIYPPGQITAYSNYGSALAGYIVEQVSGMPYEEYVQEHILKTLGMTRSTFRRPPSPELATDLAVGYSYEDGAYQPQEEWVQPAPAGGLTTTATDMARFMMAHLHYGSVGDASILRMATAQEMHRRQFTNDPRVNGWTFGFMEAELNGQCTIWHGGATNFFHSALVLMPEQDVGIFVSFNSIGGSVARQAFIQAFLDHYYPVSHRTLPIPPADFSQRIEQYTGTYLETRHNQSGVEKLLSLQAEVTVEAMGATLKTVGIGFGWPERETARWAEVEPYVLQKIEGEGRLIFRTDIHGTITGVIDMNDPQVVYQKLAWYETGAFQLNVLLICILTFFSTALVWPIRLLLSRLRGHGQRSNAFHLRLAKWLAWSFSVLSLCFIVAFFGMMTDPEIVFRVPPALERLLLLPWILVAMTIGLIGLTVLVWARRYWGVRGQVHFTAVTLAGVVFLWWMNHWNLLFNVLQPR
jgi:CubicO group peptidase (beta-lactamase class C family)/heat shock protein HslJ